MSKTVYRLINRLGNQVMTFSTAQHVASYMLGRRLDAYIVVKTSHLVYDRVVSFTDYENYYEALVLAMENA